VILHASSGGGSTSVRGTLAAAHAAGYQVSVYADATCDPSGATATIVGSVSVTTDGSGNSTFTQLFNQLAPAGQVVMGTATEQGAGTSALSACTAVVSRQCPDDTTCSGYTDAQKIALGKDPFSYCAIMRADVTMDGVVASDDLGKVAQYFSQPVPPAPSRFDQNGDNLIAIGDLGKQALVFGQHVVACP